MSSKSRRTQIVAHRSKKALEKIFPDMTVNHYILIEGPDGYEKRLSYSQGAVKDEELIKMARLAGFMVTKQEESYQYQGYITLPDGRNLRAEYLGERKTGIIFESDKDEAEHYEEVDDIVKQLALKDVAVLRGECEITITTRC
jgi:hypothetical protein